MSFPKLQIGSPALVLAPMEGVTDAPMRALQTEKGAFDFCVSEFIRVSHEPVRAKVFLRDIPELKADCKTASGTPVQIQILGGDPERMAESAVNAVALGAQAIDINFGCPAPTVNRNDGGATLLKFPGRIRAIVSAVRQALAPSIPVSAKLRLGWDSTDAIHENATAAAQGGASWITIHARTRMAGYRPPVYWNPVGEVRKALSPLPVVANGDIWTLEDFRRCQATTGCQHFMLGRGALVDPYLPLAVRTELGLSTAAYGPFGKHPEDWSVLFERFAGYAQDSENPSLFLAGRIKQWVKFATVYGSLDWLDRIKQLPSFEAIQKELRAS